MSNKVDNVDVFISYQHESENIVIKLVDALEKNGIKCWYAPRNIISGSYAKSICEGIEKCKVFLLVLSDEASNSQHVLNEVELAYKRLGKGIILMPFKITEEITNEEMNYYINRLQWIDAVNKPLEKAINDLLNILKPMFGISDDDSKEKILGNLSPTARNTNKYLDSDDIFEIERLRAEGELLYQFESNIYDKVFFGRDDCNVLDVNVLSADDNLKRLYRKEVKNYLGLVYNENVLKKYQEKFDKDDVKFRYIDLDDLYFDVKIKEYMQELGIKTFDLINLSMVILDLKDPMRVLSKLRRLLSPNGKFYIRDIDDGLTIYYPDEDGVFKKYFELADADKFAGFRNGGRQIFQYLKKLGAKNIELPLYGLPNVSLDYNDKSLLFQSYFTFLRHEYIRLVKQENNEDYLLAKKWLDDNMPIIEEKYFDDNFFFVAGFIIFIAEF